MARRRWSRSLVAQRKQGTDLAHKRDQRVVASNPGVFEPDDHRPLYKGHVDNDRGYVDVCLKCVAEKLEHFGARRTLPHIVSSPVLD